MSKTKGKKKNNEKKSISILKEVDKSLDSAYDNIMDEISALQLQLNLADQKARRKAKKKIKKDPNYFNHSKERFEARKEVISKIQSNNLLDRLESLFRDLAPIVIVISRLVASLILSILSLDIVKINISPETLQKMQSIYKTAKKIG